MEFATGAMSSLLPKLGELLLEEYNLKESVKKGIGDLTDELESMKVALEKVSSVPLDQLDPQVKLWANEVRELSYAIEDSLDSSVTRIKGGEPSEQTINWLKKVRNKYTKISARHEIASGIKDIESQVMKIKQRYDRYKIDDIVSNVASTTVDPRLSALYNKASDLVGTDGPSDELMKILSEGAEVTQKIVSIVGFGGLGKTTLAKALYNKLSHTFECTGFVPVGQNQGAKKVLRDILFELSMELYKDALTLDEWQLIKQLQKFLAGKRYFIVIDDLWDITTWETIKFAFLDSHPESRIIITTRIFDVATKAGGIYRMKPLSDDNSKMLFHTRTRGVEGVSQDNQHAEVTDKIIKKCGGVPLAIITIASLLAGKPSGDWSKVYDAIGFGHEDSEVIQNTRKILSFSYYDLPSNLKACLLYLSMFPEDYLIEKKSLIWRWVIEGFVPAKEGIGSYELGEIYFNKLVNKSMINFIESNDEEDNQGGCRVHDMVLDFIRTMSSDINFVAIDDIEQHITYSRGKKPSRIHRLALHGKSAEHNTSIQMEHVRSLNAFMCGGSKMALLSSFKVLRVLVIEECDFLEGHSLEHLGKLVQLRYLGLVRTAVKLPERIGHGLKFLEILDVRGGLIHELPATVGELNNLRCLWADKGTIMKGRIGKLTSLEELQLYSVEACPNFFTELGKLTNLRVLQIQFNKCEETVCKGLAGSLCNLQKIRSLVVKWMDLNDVEDFFKSEFHVGSLEDLVPDSQLRILSLAGIVIPRVPSCISSVCFPLLCQLCLFVEVVEAQDLQSLGRLPSLLFLVLGSEEEKRISYTFGSDEFQKLRVLVTNIEITLGEGALPRLEQLCYSCSAKRKHSLVPWNNSCPLLERVLCRVDCSSGWKDMNEIESVLEEAQRDNLGFDVKLTFDRQAARLNHALASILHGLDRPYGADNTVDRRDIRRMIKSLEDMLCLGDEARIGRYREQELRDIVTRLESWLHDNAGNNQQEEPESSDAERWHFSESDTDNDDDGDDEQEEADNDDATSSMGHEEGAASQHSIT